MFFMTRKLGWNIDQPKEPEMFYIERHPGETRAEFEVRRKLIEMPKEPPMTTRLYITLTISKSHPSGQGWINEMQQTRHLVSEEVDVYGLCAAITAMAEDPPSTETYNADTPANKSAKETIDHITGGRVHPEIRKNLRGVLDKADAPPAGREKADGAVGRAIRLGGE